MVSKRIVRKRSVAIRSGEFRHALVWPATAQEAFRLDDASPQLERFSDPIYRLVICHQLIYPRCKAVYAVHVVKVKINEYPLTELVLKGIKKWRYRSEFCL